MFDEKQRAAIDTIMENHGALEWKIIEDIPSIKFPTSADAHFVIIPGPHLDLTQYRFLKNKIDDLFEGNYFEFYTLDDITDLVDIKRLKPEIGDVILDAFSNYNNNSNTYTYGL